MNSPIVINALAALGSTFFGLSYSLPKPWCFASLALSGACIVTFRLLLP